MLVSLTWQKTEIDTYQNPLDRNTYWNLSGPGRWLTVSHVFELPVGPGKQFAQNVHGVSRMLVEGWQFSGVTQFQDGGPISPTMIANTLNVDNYTQAPDRIASGFVSNPNPNQWFDPSAFKIPAAYKLEKENTRLKKLVADLSLDKNFYIREGTRLVFRWQLFNTFNHDNPANPDTRIDAPSNVAAHITNVQRDMRRMQLGLHLYF